MQPPIDIDTIKLKKSEHTVNGQHYPIEAHFVNKADNGHLAVVDIFLTEEKENRTFTDILRNVNSKIPTPINLKSLMPNNLGRDKLFYS